MAHALMKDRTALSVLSGTFLMETVRDVTNRGDFIMASASSTLAKKASERASSHGSDLVDPGLASNVEAQLTTLREDMAELTRAVSMLATDTTGRWREAAGGAAQKGKKRLEDAAEEAMDRAAVAGDDAYAAGHQAAEQLRANVNQNPIMALAIAAGVGFLAGALAKR